MKTDVLFRRYIEGQWLDIMFLKMHTVPKQGDFVTLALADGTVINSHVVERRLDLRQDERWEIKLAP